MASLALAERRAVVVDNPQRNPGRRAAEDRRARFVQRTDGGISAAEQRARLGRSVAGAQHVPRAVAPQQGGEARRDQARHRLAAKPDDSEPAEIEIALLA